jgi:hypothetical protein
MYYSFFSDVLSIRPDLSRTDLGIGVVDRREEGRRDVQLERGREKQQNPVMCFCAGAWSPSLSVLPSSPLTQEQG